MTRQPHPQGDSFLQTLTPEFRLAVACSLWPPGPLRSSRVAEALHAPIDWDGFLRVVKRHRVAGLVSHALTDSPVPAPARLMLDAARDRLAQQSLVFAGETLRLSHALAAAGISAACLKGSALSELAFGNIALRHSRDIDVLIAPEDAGAADTVMRHAGYQMTMPIGPHTHAQKRAWMRVRKHFEYIHPTSHLQVELHWRLFDNPRLVDNSRPVDRSVPPEPWIPVSIGGPLASLLTLPSRELLLYLCVHGANHMWFRLKWIADVGALLANGAADPKLLLRDADGIDAGRAVAQALQLSHLLFDTAAPALTPAAAKVTRQLVGSAVRAMTAGGAATELEAVPFGTSRVALARYRLRINWRFWLQELRSGLLDERDRESSRLPASLTFLLPLLRIPFWLARRAAGLGRSNREPRPFDRAH